MRSSSMRSSFGPMVLVAALTLAAGCQAPTRTVTGQLSSAYSTRVDNPVIIARTLSHHRAYIAHVSSTGAFKLTLPAGATYRLILANTQRSGVYRGISRVSWPGGTTWARLGAGHAAIQLGAVRPVLRSGTVAMLAANLAAVHPATGGAVLHIASDQANNQSGKQCSGTCGDGTHEQDDAQECNSDDGEVGNTDDGQVTENVEVVADSPQGDDEINQDSNSACGSDDNGGATGGGDGNCTVNADCTGNAGCFDSHCSASSI